MERSEGLETFSWAVPTPWGPVETSGTGGVIISGFALKSRRLISDFVVWPYSCKGDSQQEPRYGFLSLVTTTDPINILPTGQDPTGTPTGSTSTDHWWGWG